MDHTHFRALWISCISAGSWCSSPIATLFPYYTYHRMGKILSWHHRPRCSSYVLDHDARYANNSMESKIPYDLFSQPNRITLYLHTSMSYVKYLIISGCREWLDASINRHQWSGNHDEVTACETALIHELFLANGLYVLPSDGLKSLCSFYSLDNGISTASKPSTGPVMWRRITRVQCLTNYTKSERQLQFGPCH